MAPNFTDIPEVVVAYIRKIFAAANNKVTRTMTIHPSMHEPTLDHILIMELTASPPAFFAKEQIGVLIESHWWANVGCSATGKLPTSALLSCCDTKVV